MRRGDFAKLESLPEQRKLDLAEPKIPRRRYSLKRSSESYETDLSIIFRPNLRVQKKAPADISSGNY